MSSVYILPTRSWFALGAVLVAMWYAAVSQGNSAAYLLMFLLGSLVVVSAYHAHFALTGLRLKAGRAAPVFAGENARLPVDILNETPRERRALSLAPNRRVFKEDSHVPCGPVPGRGSVSVQLALPTTERGRWPVRRVALTTVYPLGFFRSWRYFEPGAELLVYPAPIGSVPLPLADAPQIDTGVTGGRSLERAGDDYIGTRNYQPGESQRHVDWRAVARGHALMVKQFSGAGNRRLSFDYEQLPGLPDVESRLSQLCRWIVDAENGAFDYGLRIGEFSVEPAHGFTHQQRCLEALALAFPKDAH